MRHFPAFLDLQGKSCLVVGGGSVATRKVRALLAAGAKVTVVAPRIDDGLRKLADRASLRIITREFRDADVERRWLVVSASGDRHVERRVFAASNRAQVFCNGVDDVEHCSYLTPAIVDRGDLVVAVSSGGSAPVLARRIREQIEALLPQGIGRLAALAGRWRKRVAAALPSMHTRRRFWERVLAGRVAELAIRGEVGAAEAELGEQLAAAPAASAARAGSAWLVGAGPGSADLLTLRGLQALQQADVILYDRLVSDEVLAMARRDAERIPVGKRPGCKANSQEEINALLVHAVAAGRRVVRLKGGDPFIFGRGGEEAEALAAAGFDCEVVPGITAAAACAAAAGIPLTHRDLAQSVALVTAHGKNSIDTLDWQGLARDRQTLVFYMAVRRFGDLLEKLLAAGRDAATPIAIVEKGSTPAERVIRGTLGQLTLLAAAHRIEAPAILIVGAVAAVGPLAEARAQRRTARYHDYPAKIVEQGQQQ